MHKLDSKIIVVTSGKGGVGKTTTSAAIAAELANRGHKTVVVDFDIGLRNLDLIMGCERRVIFDFVNVIQNEANLNQALIKDKRCENLFILPASQTRDKDALTSEGVEKVLDEFNRRNFGDVEKNYLREIIWSVSKLGLKKGSNKFVSSLAKAILARLKQFKRKEIKEILKL